MNYTTVQNQMAYHDIVSLPHFPDFPEEGRKGRNVGGKEAVIEEGGREEREKGRSRMEE